MAAVEVADLDGGLGALVEPPVRDEAAVRRPLPRLRQTELLLVHPVEVAVVGGRRRVGGEAQLLLLGEVVHVHVAVALVAHQRPAGRELRCAGPARREGEGPVGQPVDVVVRRPGPPVQGLEVRLEDEVLGILRPLERLVGERVGAAGEGEAARPEQQAVGAGRRVEDADLLPRVRPRYKGIAPPAVDPVDVAGPRAAGEGAARLQGFPQVAETRLFLGPEEGREQADNRRRQDAAVPPSAHAHRRLTVEG